MYLQHIPTLLALCLWPVLTRRWPLTNAAATCLAAFLLLHVLGARYIYSYVPYDRWAQTIAGGDWLGRGIFFQAPLYPYFLAGIFALAGHRLLFVYLAQIALSLVGCWALYRAGRLAAAPAVGLGAAALHALYGPFVFHDVLVLKESLAVTVACCLLVALLREEEINRLAVFIDSAIEITPLALHLNVCRSIYRRL